MALFNPCMKFKNILGQMHSLEVVNDTIFFIKCFWLRPSAYLSGKKWINRIISKSACAISKILFILGSYKFLAYLKPIRSYAWSNGHSDPDLSSVNTRVQCLVTTKKFLKAKFDSTRNLYHPKIKRIFELARADFENPIYPLLST